MVLHRAEPDYYDTVTTPMDFSMIQQKLKNEDYDDIGQMSSDMQLIVSNAKAVYGVSTTITRPVLALVPCGPGNCGIGLISFLARWHERLPRPHPY